VEKYDSEDAFREYMRNAALRYFNYERQTKTPIHDTVTLDLMKLLNPNNYEKGAWVLHMLRSQLGDEAFFKGLRNYYSAHVSANASTEDLRSALEKSSGKNLKEFFARWVYGTGHPRYQVLWDVNSDHTALKVTVNQLQDGEAFLDPLPIEITVDGEKLRSTIKPKSKMATLTIPLKGKLTSTELDPSETLLKEIVKN